MHGCTAITAGCVVAVTCRQSSASLRPLVIFVWARLRFHVGRFPVTVSQTLKWVNTWLALRLTFSSTSHLSTLYLFWCSDYNSFLFKNHVYTCLYHGTGGSFPDGILVSSFLHHSQCTVHRAQWKTLITKVGVKLVSFTRHQNDD